MTRTATATSTEVPRPRRRRRPPPLIVPEPRGATSLPPQCYEGWGPVSPTRTAEIRGGSSRPHGAATRRGARRRCNEDRAFSCGTGWGVCDGHGGWEAAEYVSRNLSLMDKAPGRAEILSLNSSLCRTLTPAQLYTGSTLTAAWLYCDRILRMVHVGDSRAAILRTDGSVRVLTADHVPSRADEAARVASAGGAVLKGRVDGVLAVSRALGDPGLPSVCADPDVGEYALQDLDAVLVLATDGLFDVVGAHELGGVLAPHADNLQAGAAALVDLAAHRGSTDDITVLLVDVRTTATDGTTGTSTIDATAAPSLGPMRSRTRTALGATARMDEEQRCWPS